MEFKVSFTLCIAVYLSSLAAGQMYQQNHHRWFNPGRQMSPRHVPQYLHSRNHLPSREHHHQRDRRVRRMGTA